MTDPSIIRQKERERRERLARVEERLRLENLKTESAKAERQRTQDMSLAVQRWNYGENIQRLIRLVNWLG